jgi:hypothetical protein
LDGRPEFAPELEGLLENWCDLLAEHAVKTRQILRKLLTKRDPILRRDYILEIAAS